ncbi:MAG TPA: enolase C-terminal domain-like protein [Burkholderiaceae bacterium]
MGEPLIERTVARRVWDSRGRPTIEVEVALSDGSVGLGIAPAGASRGTREALDRRDGGDRLGGLDVRDAVDAVRRVVAPALRGVSLASPLAADAALLSLDGTPAKTVLGGNVTVAASIACARAHAASVRQPLWAALAAGNPVSIPLPEIQVFGGGAHAGRRIDVQDLMVIARGAASVEEALEITAEVYLAAARLMAERGAIRGVADEGGLWPMFDTNEQAIETLLRSIEAAGYAPGDEVAISLDIAASEFGSGGVYRLGLEQRTVDRDGMAELLGRWLERYPICSIEDPLAEDDEQGMRAFTKAWGSRVQIIGDDFVVTNAALIEAAAAQGACNAALIKPNQAGTLSESLAALEAARRRGWSAVVSARSGETEDTTICDLAIGWNARQIKVGSITRGERTAKWNALIRAEQAIGASAFASGGWLRVSNAGAG